MADPIRVMLVDDHALVREGVASLLAKGDIKVVAEAADGAEALEKFAATRPDVTLMDLRMPNIGGLQTIAALHQAYQCRILVLTISDSEEDLFRALRAGARGYVLKSASSEELINAVRQVAAGQRYIMPELMPRLDARMPRPTLTRRERDVLRHIVDGKSNKEIADLLDLTEGTVKQYINLLFGKIGVKSRTEAAFVALRHGIADPSK